MEEVTEELHDDVLIDTIQPDKNSKLPVDFPVEFCCANKKCHACVVPANAVMFVTNIDKKYGDNNLAESSVWCYSPDAKLRPVVDAEVEKWDVNPAKGLYKKVQCDGCGEVLGDEYPYINRGDPRKKCCPRINWAKLTIRRKQRGTESQVLVWRVCRAAKEKWEEINGKKKTDKEFVDQVLDKLKFQGDTEKSTFKQFVETEVEVYIDKQKVGKWNKQQKADAVGFLTSIYLAQSNGPQLAEKVFERMQLVLNRKTHRFVDEQRLFVLKQILNIGLRRVTSATEKLRLSQSWIDEERIRPLLDPNTQLDKNMHHLRLKIHSFVVKFFIEAERSEEAKAYAKNVTGKDTAFHNQLCKVSKTLQEALEMLKEIGEDRWYRGKDTFNTLVTLIKTKEDMVTFWKGVVIPETKQIRQDVMVCDSLLHQLFLLSNNPSKLIKHNAGEVMTWPYPTKDQILLFPWRLVPGFLRKKETKQHLNIEYLPRLKELKEEDFVEKPIEEVEGVSPEALPGMEEEEEVEEDASPHQRKESSLQCAFRLASTALMCFSYQHKIMSTEQLKLLVKMFFHRNAEGEKEGRLKVLKRDDSKLVIDTHALGFRGSYPRLLALAYYLPYCLEGENNQGKVSVICGKGNKDTRKGCSEKQIIMNFCRKVGVRWNHEKKNQGKLNLCCYKKLNCEDLFNAMWETIEYVRSEKKKGMGYGRGRGNGGRGRGRGRGDGRDRGNGERGYGSRGRYDQHDGRGNGGSGGGRYNQHDGKGNGTRGYGSGGRFDQHDGRGNRGSGGGRYDQHGGRGNRGSGEGRYDQHDGRGNRGSGGGRFNQHDGRGNGGGRRSGGGRYDQHDRKGNEKTTWRK